MLLDVDSLAVLAAEAKLLIADPTHRSPKLYTVLDYIATWHIRQRYRLVHEDVREQLILNAIVHVYIKLPRYSGRKSAAARRRRGYRPDFAKAVFRFVEVIITTSMLSTLLSIKRHTRVTLSLDDMCGIQYKHGEDDDDRSPFDVAALSDVDIDAEIDDERRQERIKQAHARWAAVEAKYKTRRKS